MPSCHTIQVPVPTPAAQPASSALGFSRTYSASNTLGTVWQIQMPPSNCSWMA